MNLEIIVAAVMGVSSMIGIMIVVETAIQVLDRVLASAEGEGTLDGGQR